MFDQPSHLILMNHFRRRRIPSTVAIAFVTFFAAVEVTTASTYEEEKQLVPTSGPVVWKQIPNPTNPKKFLPSYYNGGTSLTIPAAWATTQTARTATWTANGLKKGYYRIEFFYYQHSGNAKCVAVQCKSTGQAGFTTRSLRLDQSSGGTSTGASIGGYVPVYKNATPYATSNAKSYVWVNATNRLLNNGTLSIRISDAGCTGGKMMADAIRLTWISGTL